MTLAPLQTDQLSRLATVRSIVQEIQYRPEYWFWVGCDTQHGVYIQLAHARPDIRTGLSGTGKSRPFYVPTTATPSDIVRACLGMAIGYEEHEVREFFRYRGAQIFGPHLDVEALTEVATRLDVAS